MSKIEKTGFINQVSEIEFVGSAGTTAKQKVVLHIPGYEYQDRVIDDEYWELTLIGSKVDQLNIHARSIGEKAKCTFYVKSTKFEKEGKVMYFVNNNLNEIKWISAASPASKDDQPF